MDSQYSRLGDGARATAARLKVALILIGVLVTTLAFAATNGAPNPHAPAGGSVRAYASAGAVLAWIIANWAWLSTLVAWWFGFWIAAALLHYVFHGRWPWWGRFDWVIDFLIRLFRL